MYARAPIALYLEFTALGRGLIAMRSLATSDNVVYDVPYSPRYPKIRTNVRVRSLKLEQEGYPTCLIVKNPPG